MKADKLPFFPGISSERLLPLGRYLPPLPPGMVSSWLHSQVLPGSWLIDPLGSTPALPLEAARAGYRVLVASNNPILTFMIETLAYAPRAADFQAGLAELGATRRGSERLETHLQALYATDCPECGQLLQASAFIWRKDEDRPHARLYTCPRCGSTGEHTLAPADLERLSLLGSDALHRSRALERASAGLEGDRSVVEEALRTYLPRPLYVLFTLLNRIEGLPTGPHRKRLLTALLLSLLDEGCSLWGYPSGRSRPRQLVAPPVFRENNLWQRMEAAIQEWTSEPAPLPVTRWPELPPANGGICLYPGRLRSLLPLLEEDGASIHPAAALAALPRPNQAFWTLSALWTGWLWGSEAVQPLKIGLERRRYDWHWHANALHSVFTALNAHFEPGFTFFALLPELTPGFLMSALAASQAAGLELDGLALRGESEPAQVSWTASRRQVSKPFKSAETLFREGMREHLTRYGEPDAYLPLYAAGLERYTRESGFSGSQAQVSPQALDVIQPAMTKVFTDGNFLTRYGPATQNLESGVWWLSDPGGAAEPLSERVEAALVEFLHARESCSQAEVEGTLCRAFPGLNSPPAELVLACLESYGELLPGQSNRWRLCTDQTSQTLENSLQLARDALRQLSARFSYRALADQPLLWQADNGRASCAFYLAASAKVTGILLGETPLPREQCVLVFPGSRLGLIQARLQRDPRLSKAAIAGWRFLKIESLREFAASNAITLARWEELLNQETPRWREATQMQMF